MKSRHLLHPIAIGIALTISAYPAYGQRRPSAARFELLALPTGETGPYGNEPLMAGLFVPSGGEDIHGPAIIFVEEGPGSHPAMPSVASRFAAERLAAKGYTVVSIFSRIDRGFGNTPFEGVASDIRVAIDHLEARGHEDIVLAGHGIGATAVSLYLAAAKDALFDSPGSRRVKAAVFLAPPSDDLRKEGGMAAPGRLEEKVAEARAILADRAPPRDPMDGQRTVTHGDMIQSPQMFLNYWGPDAKTRIGDYVPKIVQPILMIAGTADDRVPAGRMAALKAAARASAGVDTIDLPGVDHGFDGAGDQVADRIAAWLATNGLGVPRRVRTELIDTKFVDGQVFPATLYTPEGGADPGKPAFLLQWGTGGDMWHSATQWLAWRLAQKGYTVLSPRIRMGGGVGLQRSTYAEADSDLKSWLNALQQRGITRVVAEGHSLGGILVSNIAVADKRIVGLVYLAPTRDSPTRARECQGDAHYAKVVAEATAAVISDGGRDVTPSYSTYPAWCRDNSPAGKGMVKSAGGGDTAFHFLDFRGPKAPIHAQVIRNIRVPGIAFWADQDPLMTQTFIDGFKAQYGGRLEIVAYHGTHGARESKAMIRDRIVDWAGRTFR